MIDLLQQKWLSYKVCLYTHWLYHVTNSIWRFQKLNVLKIDTHVCYSYLQYILVHTRIYNLEHHYDIYLHVHMG
jgi:hypothetical protein